MLLHFENSLHNFLRVVEHVIAEFDCCIGVSYVGSPCPEASLLSQPDVRVDTRLDLANVDAQA